MMVSRKLVKDAMHVVILLALIFSLIFVLTWTDTMSCSFIPGWCGAYYTILGSPKVAVVHGESGLGEPELLQEKMANPRSLGVRPTLLNIEYVNPGNLAQYDLVIVEKARKMSTEKVTMFIDYANFGGKLIWTGDAGAELADSGKFLHTDEVSTDANAPHDVIGPWARKLDNRPVRLDQLLGVEYIDNYCDMRQCNAAGENCVGLLNPVSNDNRLVYGFGSGQQFCVSKKRNFAIVKPVHSGTSTVVMTIDFLGNFIAGGENYGNNLPLIITNSKSRLFGLHMGQNVAYYALPPEYFLNDEVSEEHRYTSLLENMYLAMVYG